MTSPVHDIFINIIVVVIINFEFLARYYFLSFWVLDGRLYICTISKKKILISNWAWVAPQLTILQLVLSCCTSELLGRTIEMVFSVLGMCWCVVAQAACGWVCMLFSHAMNSVHLCQKIK